MSKHNYLALKASSLAYSNRLTKGINGRLSGRQKESYKRARLIDTWILGLVMKISTIQAIRGLNTIIPLVVWADLEVNPTIELSAPVMMRLISKETTKVRI